MPQVRSAISRLIACKSTIEAYLLAGEAKAETTISFDVVPNQAIQNAGRMYLHPELS